MLEFFDLTVVDKVGSLVASIRLHLTVIAATLDFILASSRCWYAIKSSRLVLVQVHDWRHNQGALLRMVLLLEILLYVLLLLFRESDSTAAYLSIHGTILLQLL